MSKPHSQTVRGTFDNPRANKEPKNPPLLGDPISLQPETSDSVQSTHQAQHRGADPYRQNEKALPHSKTVRGTLVHASGPKVNRSMLGDPVSLKAETSESDVDMGAGQGEDQEDMEKAAEKRDVGSKL